MDKKTADKIYSILEKLYPEATCALVHKSPLQLMVSTILSAQCTDKRVNMVTKDLFKKYKDVNSYASADQAIMENDIRSTGFYRNKARNIIVASRMIISRYGGRVPHTMEELVTLPGVARKTANIVLFHGFGKNEGIAVDTHVRRVSGRLALTSETDPVKIEMDLMALFDTGKWGMLSDLLIAHGRNICDARKPLCRDCSLAGLCPSSKEFMSS